MRDPHTLPISNVETQRFIQSILHKFHAPMCLWHKVNIDDGRHPPEVIWQTDFDAGLWWRLIPRKQFADGVTTLHRQGPIAIELPIAFTWHTS